AAQILSIIESYGVHFERGIGSWDAFDKFLPVVAKQVERNERVRLLLPGFPFKSPNSKDLVLGTMPDLGEELALAHLNGLCENISTVYGQGAEVQICSDGVVYNDLVGVPDETVWDYGEALREVAVRNGLHNITFIRLSDLLDHPGHHYDGRESAKAYYAQHVPRIRRELVYRYGDPDFDVELAIKSDKDVALTYSTCDAVLTKDLAGNDRNQSMFPEAVAQSMLIRGKAHGTALQANRRDFIRLSIHDSVGKGKLSVSLIPHERGSIGLMPWRSSVAIDADGSYRTVYPDDVRDTHDLIRKNGQPYFFRIKSDLFDWSSSGLAPSISNIFTLAV
ncbi:uncharacterized protein BDZ99DRAFT_400679, partial [Mytilinidion resinicola]